MNLHPLLLAALPLALLAPTAAHASTDAPVLGSPNHLAPNGEGWGEVAPEVVFNGGDPAGDVNKIQWKHWGAPTAKGRGLVPLFRPGGGYYAEPGVIVLRADHLGTCADGTYGYTRLYFRVAHRPGGAVGKHWRPWASQDGDICSAD